MDKVLSVLDVVLTPLANLFSAPVRKGIYLSLPVALAIDTAAATVVGALNTAGVDTGTAAQWIGYVALFVGPGSPFALLAAANVQQKKAGTVSVDVTPHVVDSVVASIHAAADGIAAQFAVKPASTPVETPAAPVVPPAK
jgi:hypothetical protein